VVPASLDIGPYLFIENDHVEEIPDSICPDRKFPAFIRSAHTVTGFDHSKILDKLTNKVTTFIKEQANSDAPFFLYFPPTAPHKPVLPEKRFRGKSGLGPYGDFVMQIDWTVGQVKKTLQEAGVDKNTIIICTSDNGSS